PGLRDAGPDAHRALGAAGPPGALGEALAALATLDALDAPVYIPGPDGPWDAVEERLETTGQAVVCTRWGQWLTSALLDPELRPLLGQDWPRYRQTPVASGRLRFAVSRFVMKHTAALALGVHAGSLDLGYQLGGRPVLRGLGGELEVSLAHTDELILVGVSRTGPIGVDAEPADRDISFELLRDQVCTPREGEELAALPEDERRARLLRLWTLKEAYTKALGHGLRRRFCAFGFARDGEGRVVLADLPGGGDAGDEGWDFVTHPLGECYVVSVAHRTLPAPSPEPRSPEPGLPPSARSARSARRP
ncbi:4'-phosphopantetheinyl transferase family protein, partial [Streptomyces goshikiensis]